MFEEFISVFFFGIITFLSPCSLALISVYLTYAVGISKSIRKGVMIGCSFAIAMCLVFFFFGYALVSLIPLNLISYRLFCGISGILLVLFGTNNLGLFRKVGLTIENDVFTEKVKALKLNALTRFSAYSYPIGPFLFGVVVSFALGPCSISLILPAMLLTLFTAPTPFYGGLILFMFGLGHSLPVIFLCMLLATARKALSDRISIVSESLTKIFGLTFLMIGIIMILYALGVW